MYIKHSKLYGFDPCFGRNLYHCVLCAIFNGSRHSSVIFHLLIYVVARNKGKERKKMQKVQYLRLTKRYRKFYYRILTKMASIIWSFYFQSSNL